MTTTTTVTTSFEPQGRHRQPGRRRFPGRPMLRALLAALVVAALAPIGLSLAPGGVTPAGASTPATSSASTVWLCRPGMSDDPCALSRKATAVLASGASSVARAPVDAAASKFDCFYVYPTVSLEPQANADLAVQKTEFAAAFTQAARFSQVCQVWAPMYRQVTWQGLDHPASIEAAVASDVIAYQSIRAGFEDYLAHYNDGRPLIVIGHSQGAAMLILLLSHLVDNNPALRSRLVLALILGGNVEVPTGRLSGGSFSHIPVCASAGQTGCVIAYSSFPGLPPATAVFGRPGQGVSLQSDQLGKAGLQVVCVNPAAVGGGSADLDPFFPSEGKVVTPWVEYPGLYRASCQRRDGATWLQVSKATGGSDHRPVVTQPLGPDWGYHVDDVNLALGNLVSDVAAAEAKWG